MRLRLDWQRPICFGLGLRRMWLPYYPHAQTSEAQAMSQSSNDQEGQWRCRYCPAVFAIDEDIEYAAHLRSHPEAFCERRTHE